MTPLQKGPNEDTVDRSPEGGVDTSANTHPPLKEVLTELPTLPPEKQPLQLWDDQRRRWEQGQRPAIESYAAHLPPSALPDALLDLIYGEFVLRQEGGDHPTIEEYQRRFPQYAAEIKRQLSLHKAFSAPGTPLSWRTAGQSATPAKRSSDCPEEMVGYKVIAPLDAGGQALVYRGVHPTLGRDVVIKLGRPMPPGGAESNALVQEGRILAELDDPGLARIFDLRMHEGRPCLVMEYIRGRNLEQDATDRPRDPVAAALLVARIARALAVAHHRGVVHRDIKPRNILIDEAGNPRLIDFGVARLEDAWRQPDGLTGLSGTLAYMAPEQARGEPPTPRCDIFALGGVLYFLLTGRAPFQGRTFAEVLVRVRSCEWDRAPLMDRRIPAKLRSILERTLAADPATRPATANELAAELEKVGRQPHWRKFVAVCAAVILVGFVWWFVSQPAPEPERPAASSPTNTVVRAVEGLPIPLQVRIGRGGRYVDLVDSVPVEAGDPVRIEGVLPAGMQGALFVLASSGKLERLLSLTAENAHHPFGYPENQGTAVPLKGPAGNELIFLCARRSGPVMDEEVHKRVMECTSWPKLPVDSVLAMSPAGVKVLQKSRDFGSPVNHSDPEGEVRRGLEELQKWFKAHFDHFEALVFSHGG